MRSVERNIKSHRSRPIHVLGPLHGPMHGLIYGPAHGSMYPRTVSVIITLCLPSGVNEILKLLYFLKSSYCHGPVRRLFSDNEIRNRSKFQQLFVFFFFRCGRST